MIDTNRIKIDSDVLKWAIKESGRQESDVLTKFPKIMKWMEEREGMLPTFRQVEELSKYLRIPLGYFFLSFPPKKHKLNADFRSINNVFPQASRNLKDTIIDMSQKQDWLAQYRQELGYEYLEINEKFNKLYDTGMNYYDVAKIIVNLLDIKYKYVEKMRDSSEYYNYYRKTMEKLGISVFQNGVVGNNTHRKLDIKEFRAFAMIDKVAPLIFINSCDSATGKVFSIVHEFIHILLGQDDIINENIKNESYINKITAEILAPKEYLHEHWNGNVNYIHEIEKLSVKLKVSRQMIALRLMDIGLISKEQYINIVKLTHNDIKKKNTSGGNYYNNLNSKLSENFTKDVISSVESSNISYTEGFRLLGNIKANAYDVLKEKSYEF